MSSSPFERSHGKARPRLPRARDLRAVETVKDPSDGRGSSGRFGKGNQAARASGAKNVVTKATSDEGLAPDEAMVARDTRKLFHATLRELPSAGTIVRTNAYSFARESSLAALYDAAANRAGLLTPEGMKLADRATVHRRVAERLSVTLLDEATALAKAKPSHIWTWPLAATSPEDASEATDDPVVDPAPDDAPGGRADEFADDDEEVEAMQAAEETAGARRDDARLSSPEPVGPAGIVWPEARFSPSGAPFSRPGRESVLAEWERGRVWSNGRDRFVPRPDLSPPEVQS